jgi:membrane protease YdiL (CAAX protease family)
MNKTAFIIVITGILLSELVFQFNQTFGFLLYSVLLGFVLISMERDMYVNKSDVLLILLMIVPIARISELFMTFNSLWNMFIFYSILTFLAVYYANKLRIRSEMVELGDFGYGIIVIVVGVLLALGAKYIFHMNNPAIIFLILFIAYAEEILFRGEIQNLSKQRYGPIYSILFTSLLYAIFSISYGSTMFLISFGASLVLCLLYYYTKNIFVTFLGNIILHSLFFAFLFNHTII